VSRAFRTLHVAQGACAFTVAGWTYAHATRPRSSTRLRDNEVLTPHSPDFAGGPGQDGSTRRLMQPADWQGVSPTGIGTKRGKSMQTDSRTPTNLTPSVGGSRVMQSTALIRSYSNADARQARAMPAAITSISDGLA